jgi:hypothetical protein
MGKNKKSKDIKNISNKLLKVPKKTNKKDSKKYELINVISETGDSIYSLPFEELITSEGKIFISIDKLNEIGSEKSEEIFW